MSGLVKIAPDEYGIEKKTATELTQGLEPVLIERKSLIEQYRDVSKLEVNEENIPQFRELRLRIRDNRTKGIGRWHETAKNFFLRGGQFVDAIKRKEIAVNEEMERKLHEAEKYLEIMEKKRLEALQLERTKAIEPYLEDANERDLSGMEQDVWEGFFEKKKKEHEERIEAEREAEQARIEAERKAQLLRKREQSVRHLGSFFDYEKLNADTSEKDFNSLVSDAEKSKADHEQEQERIRKEAEARAKELEAERKRAQQERIEREKKEAEERKKREAEQRKAEAERKALEAKLEAERKERERIESERKAKEKAEAEARAKAEKAPDKDKLLGLIQSLSIEAPGGINTKEAKTVYSEIETKFNGFKKWSTELIRETLS